MFSQGGERGAEHSGLRLAGVPEIGIDLRHGPDVFIAHPDHIARAVLRRFLPGQEAVADPGGNDHDVSPLEQNALPAAGLALHAAVAHAAENLGEFMAVGRTGQVAGALHPPGLEIGVVHLHHLVDLGQGEAQLPDLSLRVGPPLRGGAAVVLVQQFPDFVIFHKFTLCSLFIIANYS